MKIIGLTGCVGSGKSTVGKKMQEHFSLKLVMTDDVGHLAMEPGTESYENIINIFGTDIMALDGKIDRVKLGQIVFGNKEKLEQLNHIIHPWVKEYLRKNIQEEMEKNRIAYYVMESAILFQSGLNEMCDEIWYVDADEEIRRERLKSSRGYTDEKIDSILMNQKENETLKHRCDVIISTNEGENSILPQLEKYLITVHSDL